MGSQEPDVAAWAGTSGGHEKDTGIREMKAERQRWRIEIRDREKSEKDRNIRKTQRKQKKTERLNDEKETEMGETEKRRNWGEQD